MKYNLQGFTYRPFRTAQLEFAFGCISKIVQLTLFKSLLIIDIPFDETRVNNQ